MELRIFHHVAGPSKWSKWQTIASEYGTNSFTITAEPVGATQLKCKVRYFNRSNKQVISEWIESINIKTAQTGAIEVAFMGIPLGSAVDGTITSP